MWLEAARPRTLPAALSPVLAGTAAAGAFDVVPFVLALIVSVSIQVGVNFANDLYDAAAGIDTAERVGPSRAVAAGLVSPGAMKRALGLSFAVAAAAGLLLSFRVGPEILGLGLLCFLAALGYSGGPRPYASAGLGEVFVFVFFGLVATIGSAYVQVDEVPAAAVAAALPIGFLASAILVANNLRDVATDAAAGKRTLAVRLGPPRTIAFFRGLVGASFLCIPLVGWAASSWGPFLALGALAPATGALRSIGSDEPHVLVATLGRTALTQLAFATLLSVGLWVS